MLLPWRIGAGGRQRYFLVLHLPVTLGDVPANVWTEWVILEAGAGQAARCPVSSLAPAGPRLRLQAFCPPLHAACPALGGPLLPWSTCPTSTSELPLRAFLAVVLPPSPVSRFPACVQ